MAILRGPYIVQILPKYPRGISIGSQDWVWQNPLGTVLNFQGHNQFDWPNPTLPKDRRVAVNTTWEQQTDRNNNLLVGKDILPENQFDWPNPTRPLSRLVSMRAQEDVLPNVIPLQAITYIFGAPLIFRNWKQDSRVAVSSQDQVWQNPLATVLSVTNPFSLDDWPNPRTYGRRVQPEPNLDLLLTTLVGQDQFFWAGPPDYDWPNPTLPKSRLVSAIAQPLGMALVLGLLVGQDTLPFNQDNWPNPVLPPSRIVAVNSQPLGQAGIINLAGQDVFPENQFDWPVPVREKPRFVSITAQVGSPLILNVLVGQDQLPGNQYSWPNPVRAKLDPLRFEFPYTIGTTLSVTNVPNQFDWPNPVWPKSRFVSVSSQPNGQSGIINLAGQDVFPENQFDWPLATREKPRYVPVTSQPNGQAGVINLAGQDQLPKDQYDWPNPTWPKSRLAAWLAQPLGQPLTAFFVASSAFNQEDWPVVLPKSRTISVLAQPNGQAGIINLAGQDVLPDNQKDWPNPVLPKSRLVAVEARQETDRLNNLLVGQDLLPQNQKDWVNPTRPFSRQVAVGAQTDVLQDITITTLSLSAPLPLDWPNPTRPLSRMASLLAQPNGQPGILGVLLGQDQLPENQKDWPNPTWPKSRLVAGLSQPLGEPSTIPTVAAYPLVQRNWPNPNLRKFRYEGIGKGYLLTLIGQDKVPGTQRDWPLPVLSKSRFASLISQPNGFEITLIPVQAVPFTPITWNNPIPVRRLRLQDFEQNLLPHRAAVCPVLPVYTIMRNTPVPSIGTMDNTAVAVIGLIQIESVASLMRNTPVPSIGAMENTPVAVASTMANEVAIFSILRDVPPVATGPMDGNAVATEGDIG